MSPLTETQHVASDRLLETQVGNREGLAMRRPPEDSVQCIISQPAASWSWEQNRKALGRGKL